MTILAQSAVVAAFVAALRAAPALAAVQIARTGGEPIDTESQQAVIVRKSISTPAGGEILGHPIDWSTVVRVECYARGAAGQASDEASDDLLQRVHDALAADPTLGGAVDEIGDPSLAWDEDEKDTALGCSIATYPVQHRTSHRSIGA